MNAYAWWTKALELAGDCGELSRDQLKSLGISEGTPEAGFYRKRKHKDGPFLPVAIWNTEGGTVCLVNGEIADPFLVWSFAARYPITELTYHAAVDGKGWPNEPSAPKDHNLPKSDDPHENLAVEFAGERETAETFLKKPITTQAQADRAAIWSKRLATIAKKATDLHKVEKQPSLDEGRRVDDRWRDLREGADALSKRLKRHMDDFLRQQDRLEQERRRKAREEAERIRREAEDAARAAAAATIEPDATDVAAIKEHNDRVAEAERLAKEAADADREAEARNANAGRTGARVSLRTFVSANVTDYYAAAKALLDANHRDLKDCIDQLANRAVKAGIEVAGVERAEEKRAA